MEDIKQAAIEHHQQGRIDEAELLYAKFLSKTHDPQASYLLGTIYYTKRRYHWAFERLIEATSAEFQIPAAYTCLGHVCNKLRKHIEAEKAFSIALKTDPSSIESLQGISHALAEESKGEDALIYARKAAELQPGNGWTETLMGMALQILQKPEDALKHYHEARRLQPADPEPAYRIGTLYLLQDQTDWAANAFKEALSLKQDHPRAILKLGTIALKSGDAIEAENLFRKAFQADPDDPDILFELGHLLYLNQRSNDALVYLRNALVLRPNDPRITETIGLIYSNMGHSGNAYELLTHTVKANPNTVQPYHTLAHIKFGTEIYYDYLSRIHRLINPATYLEIGIETGHTLSLASEPTQCIGVDPEPVITYNFNTSVRIYPQPSDDYFEQHSPLDHFGKRIDMSFIDGLHVYEQALRDFINVEKYSHPNTVVLVHDCLPFDDLTAMRDRQTTFWTGDPWKVLATLIKYRPDLKIITIPAPPTGLGLITNLNPDSSTLADNFEGITKEFIPMKFSEINNPIESMNVADNKWESVERFILSNRSTLNPHQQNG